MKWARPIPGSRSSTALVDIEFIEAGTARLAGGGERAALEIEPINLALQGEEERTDIWRRYRQGLSALPGPVSMYVLARPRGTGTALTVSPPTPRLEQLALADVRFQAELIRDHLVQDQRHLLLVSTSPALPGLSWLTRRLSSGSYGSEGHPEADLDLRSRSVAASLGRVDLRSHRLGDGEWLELLQGWSGGSSGRRPATFPSWLAPAAVEIGSRELRIDGRVARSLAITGLPRRVGLGWLAPLVLAPPCHLRLAEHVYPVPKLASLSHLRRRIRSFETSLQVDHLRGQRPDRGTEAALSDAVALEGQVLLEEERLFRMGLYVTLEAGSSAELGRCWEQTVARLAEIGCSVVPLTNRQVDGWRSTLPTGVDPLGWGRDMTASALATSLPFMRANLSGHDGVLLGPSLVSQDLVLLDPFATSNPNFNVIVLGTSGAGKSYTTKLLSARLRLRDCQLRCIDPAGEFRTLVRLLGGAVLDLGGAGGGGLNALGPRPAGGGPEAAAQRAADALSVLELLATRGQGGAGLGQALREQLEMATERALKDPDAGLGDLVLELEGSGADGLARRLRRFTEGVDRGIFDGGQSSPLPESAVICLSRVQGDRRQLLPAVMQMVLLHLEAELSGAPGPRRLVVVDEAEVLLSSPRTASSLERLSRGLRKLGAGLVVISQVVEDFLDSEVGNVIIRNCHTKLLLRQEEVAIPALRRAFRLSAAECDLLREADPGSGLALVGRERAAFAGAAPPEWEAALRTDARPRGEEAV